VTTENQSFEIDALDSDTRARIEAIGKDVLRLGKKDTETTFKLGALLEEASGLIGDDKASNDWLVSELGITPRHGRNLRAVHRNLAPYKSKCLQFGVAPTNLYKLAYADAESVETVLRLYEDGKKPLCQDVDAIVKRKSEEDAPELPIEDQPGLNGLAKYGAQELRLRIARLKELLLFIIVHLIEAYEPKLRGRAVIKSHLRENIRLNSEEAYELLKILIGLLRRHQHAQGAIGQLALQKPDNDGGWTKLLELLRTLQYVEDVPSKTLPDYLIDTAIPQMKWALGLKDADIETYFKAAEEKNNPGSSKKAKPKSRAPKTETEPQVTEADSEEEPSKVLDEAAVSELRKKFKLPDFMTKPRNDAA
jgi:hypothetical protein